MNITDLLLKDNGTEDAIDAFARKYGLDGKQARDVIGELAPKLGRGMGYHTKEKSGMDSLMDALETGNHSRYIEKPDLLGQESTVKDGNDILGHIFGDKQVSRDVSERAAKKTGLSSTLIKKMLPVIATMVMGALSKKVLGGGSAPSSSRSNSGGLLTQILDRDNDGSMIDDVLGMAFKMAFK